MKKKALTFSRQVYGGKPTKWILINRFYTWKRSTWTPLRNIQRSLFLEGKLSPPEYLHDLNVVKNKSWIWVEGKLDQANTRTSPIKSLQQIDIHTLATCIEALETEFARIVKYVDTIKFSSLEECPGYVFNKKFGIQLADRVEIVQNEDAYEFHGAKHKTFIREGGITNVKSGFNLQSRSILDRGVIPNVLTDNGTRIEGDVR